MKFDQQLIIYFVFFFCGMTAFSLLINSILLRFVKTLGTKNQPNAVVRWSAETKPAIGGLSFFIVFLLTICIYSIIFDPAYIFDSIPFLGLLTASTLGFIMGLTDDAYNTRPVLKFLVQVLCGIILLQTGTRIDLFDSYALNSLLTVIWVVGIMNSINMLDNMDGISATVSGFIFVAVLGTLIIKGGFMHVDFLVFIGLLAAMAGFLFFNWHPSSMYMGDTGSQFLGVALAYAGIKYCWNITPVDSAHNAWLGVAALVLVFILPLADTITVTINRLLRAQSPFVGGKDHTTHNLSYLGLTDKTIALIYSLIAAISVVFYLLLVRFYHTSDFTPILFSYLFFLFVFLFLYGVTLYNKSRDRSVFQTQEPLKQEFHGE